MNPLGRYGWIGLRKMKQLQGKYLFVCGLHSNIIKSTDGGSTWMSQMSNLPTGYSYKSRNLVVTIPGIVTLQKECVMVAHYDCAYDAPGADDNASGTSAVMEAARILKDYQFESTIELLAVSAEEPGTMGSGEYASQARNQNRSITGVVNGDMIGYPIKGDVTRLVLGSFMARNWLVDSAIVYNQRYSIGARLDTFIDSTAASDHGPFAMAGYDALDVAEGTPQEIWAGGNPYYHKPSDSLDKLNAGLMRRAAQLMIATVAELAKPIGKAVAPLDFTLEQNFPNPFNPSTTFRFKLSQPSYVTLKVYNLLGKDVATVFVGNLEAAHHSITWMPTNLSSGIYFYRVLAGSFSDVKKMILIK
jgi:hypothetical protein